MIVVMLAFLSSLVPVALFMGFGWHPGYRSERRSLFLGMVLGLFPLSVAAFLFGRSSDAPIIHDISTDTVRPPDYQAVIELRSSDDNPLQWSEEVAQAQRQAYPQINSIASTLSADEAFARARQVAIEQGWEIVDDNSRPGYIEAVATTYWFGFRDDIVIRIEATDSGSVVDIRSASRVGRGDMGTNARRISAFLTAFNAN
jgi:uncharacterized protein (DUF1499 family)